MEAAELNRLLANAVSDLAARPAPRGRDDSITRASADAAILREALGLEPLPPRTDLKAKVTGVLKRDGYRIEKLRYESRPGLLVTAHLYMPDGDGPFPAVLSPHGHWKHKKTEPVVQARGIGLALAGFACLIVDSPGFSWDQGDWNERQGMGTHDDAFLAMGAPVQGVYVWDLMRGLDYLETRPEIDAKKVGITGASGGGTATMLAFAADPRIAAAVPVCAVSSLEVNPNNGCLCNHVPGSVRLGDRSDILALRVPSPIMVVGAMEDPEFPPEGMRKTYEKLRGIYSLHRAEAAVRLELFDTGHDYDRRMREAMMAFFSEHLKGEPRRSYLPEKRPLTDGGLNPYEAGTEPPLSSELQVTGWHERTTLTFRDLLQSGLREPYPRDVPMQERLLHWGRYGRLTLKKPEPVLAIHDAPTTNAPKASGSIPIPVDQIDLRLCLYLGVSVSEFVAQVFHLLCPGRPEGWEAVGLGDGVIAATVATVKGLFDRNDEPLRKVVAEGPISSLVARYLAGFRPGLEIEVTHRHLNYAELIATGVSALSQPNARYRRMP